MTKFGDPGFQYHKALAEVLALLILELADSPILPLDNEIYASHISDYVKDLERYAKEKGTSFQTSSILIFGSKIRAVESISAITYLKHGLRKHAA